MRSPLSGSPALIGGPIRCPSGGQQASSLSRISWQKSVADLLADHIGIMIWVPASASNFSARTKTARCSFVGTIRAPHPGLLVPSEHPAAQFVGIDHFEQC